MDRIALEWKCQKTFAVIYIAEQCVRAAMTHRAIESRAIAYCAGSCQKTTAQSHRSWRALSAPSRGRRPNYRRRTAVGVVDVASLSPMTSCPAAADRFPVPPRQIRLSPRRSAQSPRSHPVGCFHFRFRIVGRTTPSSLRVHPVLFPLPVTPSPTPPWRLAQSPPQSGWWSRMASTCGNPSTFPPCWRQSSTLASTSDAAAQSRSTPATPQRRRPTCEFADVSCERCASTAVPSQHTGCRKMRREDGDDGWDVGTVSGTWKNFVDEARDVEGSHGRIDEKVGVVERAESRRLRSAFGVVPDSVIIVILVVVVIVIIIIIIITIAVVSMMKGDCYVTDS